MNTKLNFISAIIAVFLCILLLVTTAFADGKGKKKGHHKRHSSNNKAVATEKQSKSRTNVVSKTIVERRYIPQPINSWATSNSPIYSYKCPFSCATEGIAKSHCRDWREGNVCFVQDTSLNNYDYNLGRFINGTGPSTGQVIGDKIDQEISKVIR